MPVLFAIASIGFGAWSFAFTNAAGVPVFGLAFAAAGFLRESRGEKRKVVFALLTIGAGICAYATFISLRLNAR